MREGSARAGTDCRDQPREGGARRGSVAEGETRAKRGPVGAANVVDGRARDETEHPLQIVMRVQESGLGIEWGEASGKQSQE